MVDSGMTITNEIRAIQPLNGVVVVASRDFSAKIARS